MPIPVTQAGLEEKFGRSLVFERYGQQNQEKIQDALETAWDTFVSAAVNLFTRESIDALTEQTLPKEARRHILSHAFVVLADGNSEDDRVRRADESSKQWRAFLVADRVRCFDEVLVRRDASTGDGVSFQAPDRRLAKDIFGIPRRS